MEISCHCESLNVSTQGKWDQNGKPIGLEASKKQLTAYSGTPIPQYGALSCPLTWRPGNGKKPRRIQSKWYVADTPGPAILGLPACESLQVITLNCAVHITHIFTSDTGK